MFRLKTIPFRSGPIVRQPSTKAMPSCLLFSGKRRRLDGTPPLSPYQRSGAFNILAARFESFSRSSSIASICFA